MESIHDVPLSADLEEFKDAVDKDANQWFCDHGISYKDDCKKCDEEWANVEDKWAEYGEITDAEIVEIDPTACDHGLPLDEPKFGDCAECDKSCNNTQHMGNMNIWRLVDKKKYKYSYADKVWVQVMTSTTATVMSSKPLCKHFMQPFELENGLVIHASADRDVPSNWKRDVKDVPDLGVYLYQGWIRDELYSTPGLEVPWGVAASWPMAWLDWPDFSIPDDPNDAVIAAQWILDHLAEGKRVETGCLGGHGRTGTMLALLLVLQGIRPGTAIERVRDKYCEEAIEGNKQIDLIVAAYESAHGKGWKKSKAERKKVEDSRPATKPASTTTSGTTAYKSKCIHGKTMDEPCVDCDKVYH